MSVHQEYGAEGQTNSVSVAADSKFKYVSDSSPVALGKVDASIQAVADVGISGNVGLSDTEASASGNVGAFASLIQGTAEFKSQKVSLGPLNAEVHIGLEGDLLATGGVAEGSISVGVEGFSTHGSLKFAELFGAGIKFDLKVTSDTTYMNHIVQGDNRPPTTDDKPPKE